MNTNNICFHREIRKISIKASYLEDTDMVFFFFFYFAEKINLIRVYTVCINYRNFCKTY